MEDICLKIENLFVKAGHTHRYQYIITFLFTIEFCCTHFLNYFIPFFERVPTVRLNGSKETIEFNYDLCDNLYDYTIFDDRKKQISIVQEFNFICNKRKIYFLGLCYHVGKFFGSCLSYLFVDRLGRKIPLIIFIPISIALMACFKFMKASNSDNWIYGIYVDLFLSGFCNYVIIIDILIYMSEIVQQTKIPYFIMTIVTGASLAGLSSTITFYADKSLDWRDILLIFAGIHLLVYIFIIFIQIDSPMFALNMERFQDFSLYLTKIASFNGKELTHQDFAFLAPYMKKEKRQKMSGNTINEKAQDTSSSSSASGDLESESYVSVINDKESIEVKALKHIKKEREKDIAYTSGGNQIKAGEEVIVTQPFTPIRKQSIFVRNEAMRDIYLLSLGEDQEVPVKSLFGESKMKDFSPLDLLRFNSQIKNFSLMTIIWILTTIIRYSIELKKKFIYDYIERLEYPICDFCLEISLPLLLLFIYHKYTYSLQRILVTSNILQFIFFCLVGFFIQKAHGRTQVVFLMLGKVCSHSVYLVMYVLTLIIYPIMIRTKGAGFNIGFSAIGAIVAVFIIEHLSLGSLILYFLLFNFFSSVMCFGLPIRIGTLLLDNPKLIKDQEDEDDVKLGDICIENAIMVPKKKKPEPKKEIKPAESNK
jgi:hypothetical protein